MDTAARVPVRPDIPEHELLRCIGTGGYGHVWLARSSTGAWRAVKVVSRELFRDVRPFEREWTGVRRFEPLSRESEAFVDVLQTGRSADGNHFYYVMELADDVRDIAGSRGGAGPIGGDVEGYEARTLSWVLREGGGMPAEACLALGLKLANGLVCLHEAGLLHRDIKPSNIVFIGGQPRLADIGLVTDLGEARSFVGTEGFIPPEGPNSPQSDIYGLGKVLYEAMTGLDRMQYPRVPAGFGVGPEGAKFLELNAVVLRACAALPRARYPTARALSEDLARVAAGQSVRNAQRHASPVGGNARTPAWARIGALLAVACVVWFLWPWFRTRDNAAAPGDPPPRATSEIDPSLHQRTLWRAQTLQDLDEGDDAEALLWMVQSAEQAPADESGVDRMLLGHILAGLPIPEATIDCGSGLFSAAFSPDGRSVATSDRYGVVQVWDVNGNDRIRGPWSTGGHPLHVSYTPDGRALLAAPAVYFPAAQGAQGHGRALRLDIGSGQPQPGMIDGILWGVFSGDGRWVAAVGPSNTLVLADTTRPTSRRVLGIHSRPVEDIAFSRDGTRVASVSDDRTARVWSVADGRELRSPMMLNGVGSAVCFDATGRTLRVLAWDGGTNSFLEHWDLDSGGVRLGMEKVPGPSRAIQRLTDNSESFMTVNVRRGITLWSGAPGRTPLEIPFGRSHCRRWTVSPDGRHAVTVTDDWLPRVWDLADGRLVSTLPKHTRPVVAVMFSPDGSRLLTASEDGLLRVWSQWLPKPVSDVPLSGVTWGADFSVKTGVAAAMDPKGEYVVARALRGSNQAVVVVPLTPSQKPFISDLPSRFSIDTVRCAEDGKTWVAHEWRARDPFAPAQMILGHRSGPGWITRFQDSPSSCRRVGIDSSENHLFVLDDVGGWRRWDLLQEKSPQLKTMPLPLGAGVALADDGQLAAVVDASTRSVVLWEWNRPDQPRARWTGSHPIQAVHFLPGSTWLVVEDNRQHRHLLDATTGKPLPLPEGSLVGGDLAGWHEPSRRILHVLPSAEMELVDLEHHRVRRWPSSPGNRGVRFARLSRDGHWAAIADREDRIRIVDASTGVPVTHHMPMGGVIRWMDFASESTLVTLVDPGRVRVWSVTPYAGELQPLREWAMLVSGRRIDPQGGIEDVPPAQLSALSRRARRP